MDKIFCKIKQFGGPSRQGGGVSGIEIALWDLAGKAYGVPLAVDHFGHICVEDCIRFARRMEPYNLAWIEDMVPWIISSKNMRLPPSLEFEPVGFNIYK